MNENATPTHHFASHEPLMRSPKWHEELPEKYGRELDEALLALKSSLDELEIIATVAHTKLSKGDFFNNSAPKELAYVAGTYAGERSIDNALTVFGQKRTVDAVVLANMPRWLTITFPKSATAASGLAGSAILVADVLRWSAEGFESNTATYLLTLASALDDDPAPRPQMVATTFTHQQHLDACIELFGIFAEDPFDWSISAASEFLNEIRNTLADLMGEVSISSLSIDYPGDLLPPVLDGRISEGLMLDAGAELSRASKVSEYMDAEERKRITLALYYYPDDTLEIDATLPSGHEICLNLLRVHRTSVPAENMLPAEGSVLLDHYGAESQYSSNIDEFEFKLHRPVKSLADDEYLGQCFLVSDRLTYTADMGLD